MFDILLETVKQISTYLSFIITASTASAIFIAPVRKRLEKMIRRVSNTSDQDKKMQDIFEVLQEQQKQLDKLFQAMDKINTNGHRHDETDVCILRNMITQIYYTYLPQMALPPYIRENLAYLYEEYEKKHGNSYVRQIYTEMLEWDTLVS